MASHICVDDRLLGAEGRSSENNRNGTKTTENRETEIEDTDRQRGGEEEQEHTEREVHMYICAHKEGNGGACRRRLVNSRRGHRPGSTRTILCR